MHRAMKALTLAAITAASLSLPAEAKKPKPPKLAPHAHIAALTESQAEAVAQRRQDQECGRGSMWLCDGKRAPGAQCYQGYNRWECSGGVDHFSVFGTSRRSCGVYITVAQGVATLRDNSCF